MNNSAGFFLNEMLTYLQKGLSESQFCCTVYLYNIYFHLIGLDMLASFSALCQGRQFL